MTADGNVIFWITILFVVVSPAYSDLQGEPGSVCVTRSRSIQLVNVPHVETFRVDASSLLCWGCVETTSRTTYKTVYQNVSMTKRTCCPGYENKNGTCKPKCQSTCPDGYCTQPNICACNSGWAEVICVLQFIFVAQTDNVVASQAGGENVKPEDSGFDTATTTSPVFPYVPSKQEEYDSIIGTVVGVVLLAIAVIYIVYAVRKRLSVNDNPSELICNDENTDPIYDNCVSDSIYDYVIPTSIPNCHLKDTKRVWTNGAQDTTQVRIQCGNIESEPDNDYDYINQVPIREYDDVNVREFDDVDTHPVYLKVMP